MMTEHTEPIDGVEYHASLEGPSHGPIVLLVHALMSNGHLWDSTVKALHEAGYCTIRFDLVGHGKTPPPVDTHQRWHLDAMTHHMHELVQAVTGQARIKAIIGCSVGGVMAIRYAMLFPEDVDAAISLCAPGLTALEQAKPLWTQRVVQFEQDVQTGEHTLCCATVDRWLPGETEHDAAIRAKALEHVKTCSLTGYKVLADAIRDYDYSDQLSDLHGVSVLVIAGKRDTAVDPELLKWVASEIKDAEYALMDCGHIPPMHSAPAFEQLVIRFLKFGSTSKT